MQAAGGLITMEDLDRWNVQIEDPAVTTYKNIEVYKLNRLGAGPCVAPGAEHLSRTSI